MDSTIIICFCTTVLLLILCVPVCAALGLGVMLAMLFSPEELPLAMYAQRLFNTFDSFPLMAIPLFILAGDIMAKGSLAVALLNMCRRLYGHVTGGLAHVSIVTCLFYGALCGSCAATTAAVGGSTIPAMVNDKYPAPFAASTNAMAGCLGAMIPPSVPLILFGACTDTSIGDLFLASILPGILWAGMLMATAWFLSRKNGYGVIAPKSDWKSRLEGIWAARWAMGVPLLVLGGIYSGIATPTEAGVVAVLYAVIVELFILKSTDLKGMFQIFVRSSNTVGLIMFVVVAANGLGTLCLYYNLHEVLIESVTAFSTNEYVIVLFILVILLIVGTFLDGGSATLILAPMLTPLLAKFGVDPIVFGVCMVIMTGIGCCTPPVGVNMFVACGLSGSSVRDVSLSLLPYIGVSLIVALIQVFVPWLSLCLL